MTTVHVASLGQLARRIQTDTRKRERRLLNAQRRAARRGVTTLKKAVPVAFGELRESVHAEERAEGAAIVIDAPHAAAVEVGSRPHWVPLAPLVAWVKLRGMQGVGTDRQVGRLPGNTTPSHARAVASQIAAHGDGSGTLGPHGSTDVDAPVAVAKSIQLRIAMAGTKPHWYARNALPDLVQILDEEMEMAVRDGGGEG